MPLKAKKDIATAEKTPAKKPAAKKVRVRKDTRQKRFAEVLPPRHDIPYFADNELNPKIFSEEMRMPVGGPPKFVHVDGTRIQDSDEESGFDINDYDFDEDDTWTLKKDLDGSESKTMGTLIEHTTHSYKRLKLEGGRPALHKRVVADMDSDDDLIVQMKQTRHTQQEIADRLKAEGRVVYNPKSIDGRWARLKKVLRDKNDELLDAEMTDWHEGDDDVLRKAIAKADEVVEKAKREAEARKWFIVSEQVKNMKPVTNFSQNACRKRFEALEEGSAKPTPESIANPDEQVLKRIASRVRKENQVAQYKRDEPISRRDRVRKLVRDRSP